MTGGVRMQRMADHGIPFSDGVFIDIYHCTYNTLVASTIRTTIDSSSMHFVSKTYET